MMDFNFDYVMSKYHHREDGAEYVYYPSVLPKRLLVTFAALNEGGHFNRIRQFWQPEEVWPDTDFLFFRDQTNQWYSDLSPALTVIERIATQVGVARVYTSGSCMGAYGALIAGLRLPAAGLLLTVTRFPEDTPTDELREAIKQCPSLPPCYIEARGLWPDQDALKYVVELYREKGGLCLFRSMPESKEHWSISLWQPPFTLRLLEHMENW